MICRWQINRIESFTITVIVTFTAKFETIQTNLIRWSARYFFDAARLLRAWVLREEILSETLRQNIAKDRYSIDIEFTLIGDLKSSDIDEIAWKLKESIIWRHVMHFSYSLSSKLLFYSKSNDQSIVLLRYYL